MERNFTGRLPRSVPPQPMSPCKWAQNGCEKIELFVTKTTHRFTHVPAADFRETCTQNVNQRGHEFFGGRIAIFFDKRSFSPKNLILELLLLSLVSSPIEHTLIILLQKHINVQTLYTGALSKKTVAHF